jgi:hypothetical protein
VKPACANGSPPHARPTSPANSTNFKGIRHA